MIPLHAQFSVPQKVVFQDIAGQAVLVDLQGGLYYGLNETATEIWRYLVELRTPAAVLEALALTQDAPAERLERDLLELTRELLARNLLIVTVE